VVQETASLTLLPVRMGTVLEARGLAVWPTQVQTGFVGQKFKIVASDPQQQAMGTGAPVWWATCAAQNTEPEHDVPCLGGGRARYEEAKKRGLLAYSGTVPSEGNGINQSIDPVHTVPHTYVPQVSAQSLPLSTLSRAMA
jgi:hypothetical protein